jgi:poly-gamma-glutamate capsule biosynthesis protein CapA/YwtB (metallophosphatase superfamily)
MTTTLFLCGDVMTGRGVDQIMARPSAPAIHEPYVRDARDYVALAERTNGRIMRPVESEYVWGDALDILTRMPPDARIINLETSITTSEDHWPEKAIHYRMHPHNVGCLASLGPDVCVLANNHVLDYGCAGLEETLRVLTSAGIATAGAGHNLTHSQQPAEIPLPNGHRVVVIGVCAESSGVPRSWQATTERSGVDLLPDLSDATADALGERVQRARHPGDLAVVSIHWGGNWGYEVPASHVRFAHRLIDAGVDVIHGHSSHHPRAIEVYRSRLVLYGCGDFIDDYEGIGGQEAFRDDLVLMYFPSFDGASALTGLRMTPLRIRRMRLDRVSLDEARWMQSTLDRLSLEYGAHVELDTAADLWLRWA